MTTTTRPTDRPTGPAPAPDHLLSSCARLGAAAGLRSMAAPAALGRSAVPARPVTRALLNAAAAGEMVADKLPGMPSRLEPGPLFGRIAIGAAAGWIVAGRADGDRAAGALVGAAAALAGAFAGYHARRALTHGAGLPDLPVALVEDLFATTLASRA